MAQNQKKKIKVYAHRAGNNLAQMGGLHAAGFRTVEGDVMLARGTPVMVHPAGLPKRLKDGNLDYDVEEVRAIVAGQDITMPTLQEMLELVESLDMRLLLEVKLAGTVERIADLIRPFKDRVVIVSFLGDELIEATTRHSHPRGFETGALMAHAPCFAVASAMMRSYGCRTFIMDQWYVTPGVVTDLHDGFGSVRNEVVAFTVNGRDRAQAMAALGVDAVLSDNPVAISQLEGFEPG